MKTLLALMLALLISGSEAGAQSRQMALARIDVSTDRVMANVGQKCGDYFYVTSARLEADGQRRIVAFSDRPEINTLVVIHHLVDSWRVVVDNSRLVPTVQLADDSRTVLLHISQQDYWRSPCLHRSRASDRA